mmetsp:Transcript_27758/g.43324  ORF Transcript_27758/g.43324 Transcript_27758/m.43324 type:complete len:124 (+) Transcript_27758:305-676(+)
MGPQQKHSDPGHPNKDSHVMLHIMLIADITASVSELKPSVVILNLQTVSLNPRTLALSPLQQVSGQPQLRPRPSQDGMLLSPRKSCQLWLRQSSALPDVISRHKRSRYGDQPSFRAGTTSSTS